MAFQKPDTLALTAQVVAAFVSNHNVLGIEVVDLIRQIRTTLAETNDETGSTPKRVEDARAATKAELRKSITDDGLVSFLDGKTYKTLKRHITGHGLSLGEYRRRFGLPADYPMTAPAYSAMRSEMAKKFGLGSKAGQRNGLRAPTKMAGPAKKISPTRVAGKSPRPV